MGDGEGNLQFIGVDAILENCPITIVVLNLLVYNNAIQYRTIAMYVCMYGHTYSKSIWINPVRLLVLQVVS